MKKFKPIMTRVMTIVHGQSEYRICCSIKSNLKIKHEIISRDKGKTSIQIDGLKDLLNKDKRFRSFKDFINYFPDIENKKGKLLNFKLFIIMDVDDCSDDTKNRFLIKELFSKHWLYDYIIPIYNDPNLEKTMELAKIPIIKKKDYIQIFPTNHGDLDVGKAKEFYEKLKNCKCTNLDEYVKYCLDVCNN